MSQHMQHFYFFCFFFFFFFFFSSVTRRECKEGARKTVCFLFDVCTLISFSAE